MNMKSCTKCGSTVNGFHKRKASKDGYRSLCKLCHNEDSRKWRSVPKNYIVMKIYQSAWNKTPKGIESSRKSSRKLYEQSNGTAQKRYNETEKGKLANRLKASRYNARKNNASICDLTAEEWEAIKKFYYHKCYYSGSGTQCSKGNLEMDHIIPLSKGGNHTMSNIVPSCRKHNAQKRDGSPRIPVQPLLLLVV